MDSDADSDAASAQAETIDAGDAAASASEDSSDEEEDDDDDSDAEVESSDSEEEDSDLEVLPAKKKAKKKLTARASATGAVSPVAVKSTRRKASNKASKTPTSPPSTRRARGREVVVVEEDDDDANDNDDDANDDDDDDESEEGNEKEKATTDAIPESDDGGESDSALEQQDTAKKSAPVPQVVPPSQMSVDDDGQDDDGQDDDGQEDDADDDDDDQNDEEPPSKWAVLAGRLDRASRSMYNYLQRTNRPHGTTDLDRAHADLTRLQVTKALAKLTAQGLAHCNDKKVHWLEQDIFGDASKAAADKLSARVAALGEAAKEKQQRAAHLRAQVTAVRREPSDADLEKELGKLRAALELQDGQLEAAADGDNSKENSVAEANLLERAALGVDALGRELKFYRAAWRDRKLAVEDLVYGIVENAAKKVKIEKVYVDIGIESDLKHNVKISDVRL